MKITTIVRDPVGMDDFRSAIERAGHAEDDFEVSLEENFPSWGVGPITGTLTVRRGGTAIARAYRWGHGTAWVAEFEKDLIGGTFGA